MHILSSSEFIRKMHVVLTGKLDNFERLEAKILCTRWVEKCEAVLTKDEDPKGKYD